MPLYDFKCDLCTLWNTLSAAIDQADEDAFKKAEDDYYEGMSLLESDKDAFRLKIKDYPAVIFEKELSMSADKKGDCPACGVESTTRIYSIPAVHQGLTAFQKVTAAGGLATVRRRLDQGREMRAARDKRKKDWGPDTHEGFTNEYWVNGESMRTQSKDMGMAPPPKPKYLRDPNAGQPPVRSSEALVKIAQN